MTDLNQGNDRGINYYNQVRAHYDRVKPMRGARAAQDVRPMRRRERTHECVTMSKRADGVWYGYRLYTSDLVMVSPTGIIEFKHGGWESVASAQFINEVGVRYFTNTFTSYKRNNKLWVADRYDYSHTSSDRPASRKYPIQTKALQFKFVEEDGLSRIAPTGVIEEVKPIIDRKKMKEVMAVYTPMFNYITTVLKMTGGLLTHDMRNGMMDRYANNNSWSRSPIYKCTTGEEFEEIRYHRSGLDGYIDVFTNVAEHGTPDDWMKVLCCIAQTFDHTSERVGVEKYEISWGDRDEDKRMSEHYLLDITLVVKPTAIRDKFARAVKTSRKDVWTSKVVNHGL